MQAKILVHSPTGVTYENSSMLLGMSCMSVLGSILLMRRLGTVAPGVGVCHEKDTKCCWVQNRDKSLGGRLLVRGDKVGVTWCAV